MGLAFAPKSGMLHAVNALTNQLLELRPQTPCVDIIQPYSRSGFRLPEILLPRGPHCVPDATIPNVTLFDQVHVGSGYASDNPAVQNDTMMDQDAALLAFRTDCESNSSLNFDALLLGGYLCHRCLPDSCAMRDGGKCTNVQWAGYTCDNEIIISRKPNQDGYSIEGGSLLELNRTYRFVIDSPGAPLLLARGGSAVSQSIEIGTLRSEAAAPPPDAVVNLQGATVMHLLSPTTTTTTTMATATTRTTAADGCMALDRSRYDLLVSRGWLPVTCN